MSQENGKSNEQKAEHLFVKHNGLLVRLRPADIRWIEASDNCAFIHTNEKRYLVSETLKLLMGKLEGSGLIRVHRSYAVNMEEITTLSERELMIGSVRIPIGRTYRKELMERITTL